MSDHCSAHKFNKGALKKICTGKSEKRGENRGWETGGSFATIAPNVGCH